MVMFRNIILFVSFFIGTSTFAQNWKLPYDKAKLVLNKETSRTSRDTSLYYAQKAFLEVEKLPEFSNEQLRMSHDIGQLLYRLGDIKTASKAQLLALKSAKAIYGRKSEEYLLQLRLLTQYKVDYSEQNVATVLTKNYLEISKEISGRQSIDYVLANIFLGQLHRVYGNFKTSEGYYQTAVDIAEKMDPYSIENALASVGISKLLITQGKYTEAEVMLRKAIHIYQKKESTQSIDCADAYIQFAYLNSILRNFEGTDKNLEQAYSILKHKMGYGCPLMTQFNMIYGHTYLIAGYPDLAQPYIDEAFLGSSNSAYLNSACHHLYGRYYSVIGDFDKADSSFSEALTLLKAQVSSKHFMVATIHNSHGNMFYKKGEYDRAIEHLRKGLSIRKEILEISHPDYLESITNLSLVYWAAGDLSKANKYFKKSTARYIYQYKTQFVFLSEKEKTLFYAAIREYFEKYNAFAMEYQSKDPKVVGNIYNNQLVSKGLLFNSTKDLRLSIFTKKSIFDKYNKYITTRELLARTYNVSDNSILNSHNLSIDSLENAANYLEKELSFRIEETKSSEERQKEFSELFTSWKDIKFVLKKDEAAIEIVRYRSFSPLNGGAFGDNIKYLALIVTKKTKKNPELIVFDNGELLESGGMKYYRNSIKYKTQDKLTYERYWQPISNSKSLQNIEQIYLAPDGVYNQISLNTLRNPENNKYLIDEFKVQLVSNTKDIIDQKSDRKQKINYSNTLLIGFPDYNEKKVEGLQLDDEGNGSNTRALPQQRGHLRTFLRGGSGIAQLPGTKVEVDSIYTVIIANNKEVRKEIDKSADEEVLKEMIGQTYSPSIVHIATHGYFQNFQEEEDSTLNVLRKQQLNPLTLSGILLSGATFSQTDLITEKAIEAWEHNERLEDGNLTAYEAMNLNLFNTDLIILSACETGLGVVQNGEGVYGLQRSFQTAGAKTVIMSLWKVDDNATKEFMVEFYKQYFLTHSKKDAFYNAQIKLRESYPEPYYWGAFVMIGE